MSKSRPAFQRPYGAVLAARLAEPRRFIQVVTGARQARGEDRAVGALEGWARFTHVAE